MLRIWAPLCACACVAAMTAVSSPSLARSGFGLRVGPLELRLPLAGLHMHRAAKRHGRARHAAPRPETARSEKPRSHREAAQPGVRLDRGPGGTQPAVRFALLHPALGWGPVYAGIFSPAGASWPFGFATIFDAAFGEQRMTTAQACPQTDAPDDLLGRIRQTVRPDAAQREALQQLAAAGAQADGYLRNACPRHVPDTPVARLQFMERQIDTLLMALEMVRLPLQQFENALSDDQRRRLAALFANGRAGKCNGIRRAPDWPIAAIGQAVQPSGAQRQTLREVGAAVKRAENALQAQCIGELPATPLARLEAVEAWLDATWRAVQTVHVALAQFYRELDEDQRKRLDALDIAELRQQG